MKTKGNINRAIDLLGGVAAASKALLAHRVVNHPVYSFVYVSSCSSQWKGINKASSNLRPICVGTGLLKKSTPGRFLSTERVSEWLECWTS